MDLSRHSVPPAARAAPPDPRPPPPRPTTHTTCQGTRRPAHVFPRGARAGPRSTTPAGSPPAPLPHHAGRTAQEHAPARDEPRRRRAPARAAVRRRLSAARAGRRAARLPVRSARERRVRGARRPGPHPRVGRQRLGGSGAPSGTGFTAIFSTSSAFAALDDQGAIHAWGHRRLRRQRRAERHGLHRDLLDVGVRGRSRRSTTRAPSTRGATARIRGAGWYGGSGAPSGTGFTAIFSTEAFAALDDQGRIHAWGNSDCGGSGAPSGTGFTAIFSTGSRVRGARRPGRHPRVGRGDNGGSGAPSGTGFTAIFSTSGRSRRSTTRAPSTRGATATPAAAARRAARASPRSSRRHGVRGARRPGRHPRVGRQQRRQRRAERHGLHRPLLDVLGVRGARRPGRHPRVGQQQLRRQRRAERHGLHHLLDARRSRRSDDNGPMRGQLPSLVRPTPCTESSR